MTTGYRFLTRCVETTAEKLERMYDTQREVKYKTVLRHIGREHLDEVFPFYMNPPLRSLGRDYAVHYYMGRFEGRPCINIEHSRIDHIFVKEGNQ